MSVFGYMETFFFISLGITFVLILMLVYHFKQRVSFVEQKGDTMFDIINNMVKEMGAIKSLVMSQIMVQPNTQNTISSTYTPLSNFIAFSQTDPLQETILETEDLDDDSEDSDNDEDEDDEDEDEDDDEDQDEDDGEDEEEQISSKAFEESVDQNKIAVSDDELDIAAIENENEIVMTETDMDTLPITELVDEPVEEIVEHIETIHSTVENPMVVHSLSKDYYQKMNIQELKDAVLTKGLAKDVSKLKKNKLIEILVSSV
jgi:hypothetical protein